MNRYTDVIPLDSPGPGGANHEYAIRVSENYTGDVDPKFQETLIKFQKGPMQEASLNGIFLEDLLAVVIHRLLCFQTGPFSCRENALALTKLQEAQHWLAHRQQDRIDRGVYGQLEP